jgi:ankyrin repeat protein
MLEDKGKITSEVINARNKRLKTPLHYAAKIKDGEMVELLLGIPQIDVSLVDETGATPLHIAASHECQRIGTLFDIILE